MREILGVFEVFLGIFKKTNEKKDGGGVSRFGVACPKLCFLCLFGGLSPIFGPAIFLIFL